VLDQYLHRYAEAETEALQGLLTWLPVQQRWENVMVIPACNETSGFLRAPPTCTGRSLMVLVINESVSASPVVSANNRLLAESVQTRFEQRWRFSSQIPAYELTLLCDAHSRRDVLLVDRFSDGRKFPVKSGVGLARKIGADLAAWLIHRKAIGTDWIHCTDADVRLPETYFNASQQVKNTGSKVAALIYPFHHGNAQDPGAEPEVVLATLLYEFSLRYYVAGLKSARSPYAFHTIGSTMAVSASHYAKVRGFPKREAGEDFYLLNKLAKVGAIEELTESASCRAIEIEARRSDRVPFGTGAAVNRLTALTDPLSDFRFYDPMVFELLRLWLQSLPLIWQSGTSHINADIFHPGVDVEGKRRKNRHVLLACLNKIEVEKGLEHAFRQSRNLEQFTRQTHTWFDAFRTLKLIHTLRDCHFTSIRYASLEANQNFRQILSQDADLLTCLEAFRLKLIRI